MQNPKTAKDRASSMVHPGQYIPRTSVIHGLDPRVKLAAVVVLSIVILKGDLLTQCWITAFLLVLVPASRLKVAHIRTAFRPMLFFLALLFIVHLLFTEGDAHSTLSPMADYHYL